MQKILAISGGVDSVCLLHIYRDDPEVIVAHFNHGTRPSSDADEEFVKKLAKEYGKKFVVGRADLGENVSEEKARAARHDFLRKVANESGFAFIFTAHHLDDLVETIAINFLRGTGWRGLAPFSWGRIARPFFGDYGHCGMSASFINEGFAQPMFKTDILKYAAENGLTFREDPTNNEDNYLRNRVREKLKDFPREKKLELARLYDWQVDNRYCIENAAESAIFDFEVEANTEYGVYLRDWFNTTEGEACELELLRHILDEHDISLTYPQLRDFLNAIKTYAPGKSFNLPKDKLIKFSKDAFML